MPAKKDAEKKSKAETAEQKAEEPKTGADEPAAEKRERPKEEPKAKEKQVAGTGNVARIAEMVETMTVLELSELVKVLEEKFGVSAAAPMMAMPAGMMPAAGGAAEEAEEQTEFDVVLKSFGSQKIQVIKVVRALTGLGLIEAKKMVEDAPSTVKEGASKTEAEEMRKQLEEAGAAVEIK